MSLPLIILIGAGIIAVFSLCELLGSVLSNKFKGK